MVGFENSNTSITNNVSVNNGLITTQLDPESAANSPFSAETETRTFDAIDFRDMFDSTSFLVDDFWRFSE